MKCVLSLLVVVCLAGPWVWSADTVVQQEGHVRYGGTDEGGLSAEAQTGGRAKPAEPIGDMVAHYFLYRLWDLLDILDLSVGVGPGFLINVHATKAVQAVGGYSNAWRIGMRGRSFGTWKEERKEIGISLLYYQKIEREKISGWVESVRTDEMDLDTVDIYGGDKDRSFLGFGATIQAGILVDVNLRPAQMIDFVLGWFTIDILEDDYTKAIRNKDL